jgi:hypothetical protein
MSLIGLGVYLNSIEGTLRQTRRSLAPSSTGQSVKGVVFYSIANTNEAVMANPFSIPSGQNTIRRPFAEFASGLTTGKSVDGLTLYEDQTANPTPVFAQPATVPVLPWKSAPTKGHVKGFARRADNTPLDTATVTIKNLNTNTERTTETDGGGFFGAVDLTLGQYFIKAVLNNETLYSCVAEVSAGIVRTADLQVETIAPVTFAAQSSMLQGGLRNGSVRVTLSATDNCTGVEKTEYSLDGGATWILYTGSFTISQRGRTTVSYRSIDRAGNVETIKTETVLIKFLQ